MVDEGRKASDVRDLYETVLVRAKFLDPRDRALLDQVLGRGVRPYEVAKVAELSTRAVQRRVRLLIRRLLDPGVEYVIRHYHQWPRDVADVAIAVWVKRWSMRRTADHFDLSLHRVRQHVEATRGLISAGRNKSKRRPFRHAPVRT